MIKMPVTKRTISMVEIARFFSFEASRRRDGSAVLISALVFAMMELLSKQMSIVGWSPDRRDKVVVAALESGLSIRQLSRLTGISKTVVERIKK